MVVPSTSDLAKADTQNATAQIVVDHGPQIGTVKPTVPLKGFLIDPFKGLTKPVFLWVLLRAIVYMALTEGIGKAYITHLVGKDYTGTTYCVCQTLIGIMTFFFVYRRVPLEIYRALRSLCLRSDNGSRSLYHLCPLFLT
jgi:hypothetical protein